MENNWAIIFMIMAGLNVLISIISQNIPAIAGWICSILFAYNYYAFTKQGVKK